MFYDENEIRKTIELMAPGLFEVRILGDKWTASGYFTSADVLIENLSKYLNNQNINCYFVMNGINKACYSRQQKDTFIEKPKSTTTDKDIDGRDWLMVDLDCERPAEVSSTDEEFQESKNKTNKMYSYLGNLGFQEPIVALSGNGVHLLYKISLENTQENATLIKNCLLALDMLFSDKGVKVDTAVFNASRITKLYGTMAVKGKSTAERPHRLSKIIKSPREVKVNDIALLINLAKVYPVAPVRSYVNQDQFNIDNFIHKNGIRIKQENNDGQGRKLILEECPFDASHTGKDAAIFVMPSGAIAFKCFHSSCSSYAWQDVRKLFEPRAYDARIEPRINSQKPKEINKLVIEEPDFYAAREIKQKDRSQTVSMETGITALDKRIIGLNKGEVTCISGLRGSGKSSILSQVCLDVVKKGYKVALFSGEMAGNKVLEWLQLQLAGKQYTKPTKYEDYFYVTDDHKKMINEWLDNNLFIYNNRKGNEANKILRKMNECIKNNKVDLILLDNLMAMDIKSYGDQKYDGQSKLMQELMKFAEDNDVHIVFVAHPRKSNGFLRMDDVSGSADISNAVNNMMICHRVNEDFKRLSGEMFKWKATDKIYTYSNVIEVCKNRELGVQDYFVGLYYEIESKRFLNEPYEPRHYGWEAALKQDQEWWEGLDD